MTFEGLKKDLVDERQVYTPKQLRVFCRNLCLACFTYGGTIIFIVACTLGIGFSAFIALMIGLLYLWLLDYSVESDKFRAGLQKFSKLWFMGIGLFIIVYLIFVNIGFY